MKSARVNGSIRLRGGKGPHSFPGLEGRLSTRAEAAAAEAAEAEAAADRRSVTASSYATVRLSGGRGSRSFLLSRRTKTRREKKELECRQGEE